MDITRIVDESILIESSVQGFSSYAVNRDHFAEIYNTHSELIDSYLELVLRNAHRCLIGGDKYEELNEVIETLKEYGLDSNALTEIRMMYLSNDCSIKFNVPPAEVDQIPISNLAEEGIAEMLAERIRIVYRRNQIYFEEYLELYVRSHVENWSDNDERWTHYHSVKNVVASLTGPAFVQRIVILFEQRSQDIPFSRSYEEIAQAVSTEALIAEM